MYYSRMAADFHWRSSIFLAFATWISGPPWFPVEPYFPPVTPNYNRSTPIYSSVSRFEVQFERFKMEPWLHPCFPEIINAKTYKNTRIRHMQPQRRPVEPVDTISHPSASSAYSQKWYFSKAYYSVVCGSNTSVSARPGVVASFCFAIQERKL